MVAFAASSALGLSLAAPRAFCGHGLRVAPAPVATTRMAIADPSPAMPFLPKPKNLSPDMIGYAGFDPMALSELCDVKWMQQAEIKHGRVCMLAFLGILVQEFVHLPAEQFANPVATEAFFQVPKGGIAQIILGIGILEFVLHRGKMSYMDMFEDEDTKPGFMGFNPLNMNITETAQLQEIKNGRLAMIGVGGVLHSMFVYKTPVIAQLLDFKPMTF